MTADLACPICTMTDILRSHIGSDLESDAESRFECATCGHEWEQEAEAQSLKALDANGNLLQDGDSVTLIKDLKVKGSGTGLKAGTKVKKIRLVDPAQNAGHEIDAKAAGMGVLIRAKFVKKA